MPKPVNMDQNSVTWKDCMPANLPKLTTPPVKPGGD